MRSLSGPTDDVVVVGAGLSGLAAALHLAGRGRKVTVVERGEHPGGRVGRADVRGHLIDTGPTVLTMPDIIDEAFAAVGDSLAGRVEMLPVDPAYRASFADGSSLEVHGDAQAMATAIERFAGRAQAEAVAKGVSGAPPAESSAAQVHGLERTLWLVDEAAASQLT